MKHFIKVFTVTTILLSLIIGVSSYAYIQTQERQVGKLEESQKGEKDFEVEAEIDSKTGKDRVNVLFLGVDGARADTIIFGTYDLADNKVDMLSIPRDTYHENEYSSAQMKKINAIYPKEGLQGMEDSVGEILGVDEDIDYFVEIDYDGVKNIVDAVGGVEVEVPFDMVYRDPYSSPPLDINISAGSQILKGQRAVDFLRYRKSNDYSQGYADGDIGRIGAQQEFISSFIDKAIGFRLPSVIKTSIEEVNTNISLKDALSYGTSVIGLGKADISLQTIPGESRYETVNGENLSYFFPDEEEIDSLVSDIFGEDRIASDDEKRSDI